MEPKRIALAAVVAAAGLLVAADIPAAPAPGGRPGGGGMSAGPRSPGAGPRTPGAGPGSGGHYRPAHPGGGHRPGGWQGGSYRGHGHYHGHSGGSYWGWGVAVGVPWALGWYDPYWWGPWYSYPSYGYAYPRYGYACGPYDDCWRDYAARSEPTPPTTEVGPVATAEEGGPTQRPLHLNWCESARAWYPNVKTCPGGWKLVTPDYNLGTP
jgi:hypothetical protein